MDININSDDLSELETLLFSEDCDEEDSWICDLINSEDNNLQQERDSNVVNYEDSQDDNTEDNTEDNDSEDSLDFGDVDKDFFGMDICINIPESVNSDKEKFKDKSITYISVNNTKQNKNNYITGSINKQRTKRNDKVMNFDNEIQTQVSKPVMKCNKSLLLNSKKHNNSIKKLFDEAEVKAIKDINYDRNHTIYNSKKAGFDNIDLLSNNFSTLSLRGMDMNTDQKKDSNTMDIVQKTSKKNNRM